MRAGMRNKEFCLRGLSYITFYLMVSPYHLSAGASDGPIDQVRGFPYSLKIKACIGV